MWIRELLCLTTDGEGNIYAAGRDTLIKVSPSGDARAVILPRKIWGNGRSPALLLTHPINTYTLRV